MTLYVFNAITLCTTGDSFQLFVFVVHHIYCIERTTRLVDLDVLRNWYLSCVCQIHLILNLQSYVLFLNIKCGLGSVERKWCTENDSAVKTFRKLLTVFEFRPLSEKLATNTQQSFIGQIKTLSSQQERLHVVILQQWVTGNTKTGDLSSVISEVCHQRGYYTWREWRWGFGDNHDSLSPSLLSRKDGNKWTGRVGCFTGLLAAVWHKGNSQSWLLFCVFFFSCRGS